MTVKITYNIKGVFKNFSIIIRDSVLRESKGRSDFFAMFEYVVNKEGSQMSSSRRNVLAGRKRNKSIDSRDSDGDTNQKNISPKKSKFASGGNRGAPKPKPSGFKKLNKDSISLESKKIFEESRSQSGKKVDELDQINFDQRERGGKLNVGTFLRPKRKMIQMKSSHVAKKAMGKF